MAVTIRALRFECVQPVNVQGAFAVVKRANVRLYTSPRFQGREAPRLQWDLRLLVDSSDFLRFKLYRRSTVGWWKKLVGIVNVDAQELEHSSNGKFITTMVVVGSSPRRDLTLAIEIDSPDPPAPYSPAPGNHGQAPTHPPVQPNTTPTEHTRGTPEPRLPEHTRGTDDNQSPRAAPEEATMPRQPPSRETAISAAQVLVANTSELESPLPRQDPLATDIADVRNHPSDETSVQVDKSSSSPLQEHASPESVRVSAEGPSFPTQGPAINAGPIAHRPETSHITEEAARPPRDPPRTENPADNYMALSRRTIPSGSSDPSCYENEIVSARSGIPVEPTVPINILQHSVSAVPLLKAIEPVAKVLDTIAKIHPIAEIVCCVITSAYKAIKAQNETDQEIVELYNTMVHAYKIATKDDTLSGGKEFSKLFDTIVRLSTDCSFFISNYSSHGYLRRMADLTVRQRIDQFKTSFQAMEREFSSLQTRATYALITKLNNTIKGVMESTQRLEAGRNLDKLKTNALKPRTPCLPGTRLSTLSHILGWIAAGKESVLWLSGIAGCGKSSLMASLHDISLSMGCTSRLGAFIRFDRHALRDASVFVKSLAYKLGQLDGRLANLIADAVQNFPQIVDHSELHRQLKTLVLEPLAGCAEIQNEGPIVILVDGLDECNQDDPFNQLLRIFAGDSFQSYPFLKIIIASRPEEVVQHYFRDQQHIHSLTLDTNSQETTRDIERFFDVKLHEFSIGEPGLLELCTKEDAFRKLAERASGLFIWASTAVEYICVRGYSTERLLSVVNTGIPRDAQSALTLLYRTALDGIVGEDHRLKADVCLVIASILVCKQAEATILWDITEWCTQLTPVTLHPLLEHLPENVRFRGDLHRVNSIVNKLGSILTTKVSGALTFSHKSFDDYVTDEGRCEVWYVDTQEWMRNMAYACLSLLQELLERDPEKVDCTVFVYTGRIWAWVCRAAGPEAIISMPPLHDLFRGMFQRCWMRWVAMQSHCWWKLNERPVQWMHHRRDNNGRWFDILRDTFPTQEYQSVKRLIGPYSVPLNIINADYVQSRNRCLQDVFDRLCSLDPSDTIYRNYMPLFVRIAKQSTSYKAISEAIKKLENHDWIPPLNQGEDVDISISEIPSALMDKQWDQPVVTLIFWCHTSYRRRTKVLGARNSRVPTPR